MSVKGIDISSNNGRNIDFHKVKKSGVEFVYIKVSQGTTYVNPYAKLHASEAKAAGLLVGAYAFLSPTKTGHGADEADYFLKHARECGLLSKGCLRPVADIEITHRAAGKPSRQYDYAFLDRVIAKEKIKPFIYTGSWFWDGVLHARNAHGCPLWLAAYTSSWKKYIPKGFLRGVSIHQETDKGRVPGISGYVDIDRYLGKNVALLKRRHTIK